MKNSKNLLCLFFIILSFIADLGYSKSLKFDLPPDLNEEDRKLFENKKLFKRARKLLKEESKKFRKLSVNTSKPKLKKKKRKLLFGDMTGGELLGILGGVGGLYQYQKGNKNYQTTINSLSSESKYQNMHLMMKFS